MSILILIVVFFILLLLGMPIAFAMAMSALAYFLFSGNPLFLLMLPDKIFWGINSFVLLALPFFMLAGELMNKSGVSERLITFSNYLIGRVRGGLAQVNVLASILFAGITGVALGDAVALGKVFIPSMEKEGYDTKFSVAVTAASSIIGPIIPPSVLMVIYAAVMQVSVGAMFIGGIIPGVLVGLSDMIIVKVRSDQRHYPKHEMKMSAKQFLFALKDALLALLMPVIIIGGVVFGVCTPTEAAAIAAVYGAFLGFVVYKTLTVRDFIESVKNAVIGSAKIYLIIGSAAILTWIFSMEDLPAVVENIFINFTANKYILLFLINTLFLFLGFWLAPGVSIILFAPVLQPLAESLGVHPIQFGIMIVVNCCIGLVTPPVGVVSFAVCDLADIDIMEVVGELMPFVIINFIIILLVAYIPELTLFLPRLAGFIK